MSEKRNATSDYLHIVWTLAAKDIVDAIKNRIVLSVLAMMLLMLLFPKSLSLIFNRPKHSAVIFNASSIQLPESTAMQDDFAIVEVRSFEEMEEIVGDYGLMPGVQMGIYIPASTSQNSNQILNMEGYIPWSLRHQSRTIQVQFEKLASELFGQEVHIAIDGHLVTPQQEIDLNMGLLLLNAVLLVLLVGITLIPTLLLEEKQTRTIEALLVAPARISQVVIGKALAGIFIILVCITIILGLYWRIVVHWEIVILFIVSGSMFSVAIGLILGSFYESPQDISGWSMILMFIMIGAMIIDLLNVKVPDLIKTISVWIPSVSLSEIFYAIFVAKPDCSRLMLDAGYVVGGAILLYVIVAFKIRRMDRG